MAHTYKIPRVTDSQIASALKTLSEEFAPFTVNVNLLDKSLGSASFPEQAEKPWLDLLDQGGELVSYFGGNVAGIGLLYYRGGQQGPHSEKSPVLDDLVIDINGVDAQRMAVASRAVALFRPVQFPITSDTASLIDAQRAIQASTYSRLQSQLEKLFEQTIDVRRQLDESIREKEKILEADFEKRREAAHAEELTRKAELDRESEALELRRKALDDSDNTFARRQIRDRMLSDVAKRVQSFGVSQTTVTSRKPVALGMMVLTLFLLTLFVWTAKELSETRSTIATFTQLVASADQTTQSGEVANVEKLAAAKVEITTRTANADAARVSLVTLGNERIALWIRISLVSLGLVASLVYYIRWQNQWAQQFAATELSLQQFQIDVNRANWVIETCLEWRKETDSVIPSTLIESMTRGLFAGRESGPQVLHPADELASALMGSASKLSLDLAGNKLEIDKPQKIPKTVSGDRSS